MKKIKTIYYCDMCDQQINTPTEIVIKIPEKNNEIIRHFCPKCAHLINKTLYGLKDLDW